MFSLLGGTTQWSLPILEILQQIYGLNHIMWFNKSDCEHNPPKQEHVSLENVHMFGLESIEQIRYVPIACVKLWM